MPKPMAPATCQYSKEGHTAARPGPPVRTPDTRRAATACLERLTTRRLAPPGARRLRSTRRVPDTVTSRRLPRRARQRSHGQARRPSPPGPCW
ncbi:hypothetical protein DIE03_10090 [Burkholderia sp. Bp8992]|nr:hypothetical protein DIE03_10090 [Burkholderia sp. Bp8992]